MFTPLRNMKKLSHTQLIRIAKMVGVIPIILVFLYPLWKENDYLFIPAILIIVASGIFASLVVHQNFFTGEK